MERLGRGSQGPLTFRANVCPIIVNHKNVRVSLLLSKSLDPVVQKKKSQFALISGLNFKPIFLFPILNCNFGINNFYPLKIQSIIEKNC